MYFNSNCLLFIDVSRNPIAKSSITSNQIHKSPPRDLHKQSRQLTLIHHPRALSVKRLFSTHFHSNTHNTKHTWRAENTNKTKQYHAGWRPSVYAPAFTSTCETANAETARHAGFNPCAAQKPRLKDDLMSMEMNCFGLTRAHANFLWFAQGCVTRACCCWC